MTTNAQAVAGNGKNGKPIGLSNDCATKPMTMGRWGIRRMKKRIESAKQTKERGKKGETCRSSSIERYMCRRNRSWKDPLYARVMKGLDKKSGN